MIYVFLADGFEEIEALTPVDVLRRLGLDVKTVGVTGKTVTGAHGITVESDLPVKKAERGADMLVLPGGMPGMENLFADKHLIGLVKDAADNNKYIAAICAAPSIPGRLGLLDGREATCFPGFEGELIGAKKVSDTVVVSDNFITSDGMGNALEFALKLGEILVGKEKATKIAKGLQIRT